MHVGAAEGLLVGDLAGGGLDQRRAGEEYLGALLDHHHVVAHARDVGAAGGRVAVDHRDGRDPSLGQAGQVAEERTTGDEDLFLRGQVRTARFHEADHRKPVLHGDVIEAEDLAQGPRVGGAALDRGVVGDEQAFDPLDHAYPGHHGGAGLEVRPPCGECAQLEERGLAVEDHVDSFAGRALTALAVAGDLPLAAAGQRGFEVRGELVELALHGLSSGAEIGAGGVQCGTQDGHAVYPKRRPARVVRISVVPPPMPRSRTSRY